MRNIWLIPICLLLTAACGKQAETPTVLVGIDGAEWQIINQMIGDGELPNFARIKNEGAWGHLINNGMETSPVVWTTFATGHFAREHGVLDHVFPFGDEGARRPVTSELRQVPALWNIADHYGLRSTVIGYFVSHPPEPINGVMVSSQAPTWIEGSIYPPDAIDLDSRRYQALLNEDVRKRIWSTYFGWDVDRAQADDPDSPYQSAAAAVVERSLDRRIIRDEFLRRATEDLSKQPTDLFITYYRIPDIVSHSLWKYYDPDVYENPPTAEELAWFGESVKQTYRFVDRALGELLEAWDGQANMVIVSDHGFGRASARKMNSEFKRVEFLTGDHRPDGVIMAHGPDIQPGQIEGLTIMEIAPTMAALLGLPVAGNLPGQIATNLIRPEFFESQPLKSVADYSDVVLPNREIVLDQVVQEDEMNTLKGLGYVGEGVEFDVSSVAEGYDFWGARDRLVASHMSSEIVYFLLQHSDHLAQESFDLLKVNRPDLELRTLAVTEQKFDLLAQRLPPGAMDPVPFEAFFEANPRPKRNHQPDLESDQ
ncbi:MAG TPA: alkaline phosphatase family protein [Xanthomonadales bacterium]|nr:alkaline phosphatase family protein [Xanthomonadales bacterium]